jgi:lipopolysaccharide export system protein LptA
MTFRPALRLALGIALIAGAAGAESPAARPKAPPAPTNAANKGAAAPSHDEGMLEVTSDHDLEWLQQDHAYVARGNAVAKRGALTLTGDILIAYYRNLVNHAAPPTPSPVDQTGKPSDAPKEGFDTGNIDIWRVVALGRAHVSSEGRDAYGDRLEYDKDAAVVVMTGGDLKGVTPEETVTARDSLEYWQDQDMAVARGNAVITKVNGEKLEGDVIGAHFVKDATGHTALKTIEAKGHVVITTATDIVHGDEGTYDLDAKRTVLFGNVRATRGESQLEGASADVNMDTGISQVFPAPGQRVKGLFVSQKSHTQKSQSQSGRADKHAAAGRQ